MWGLGLVRNKGIREHVGFRVMREQGKIIPTCIWELYLFRGS